MSKNKRVLTKNVFGFWLIAPMENTNTMTLANSIQLYLLRTLVHPIV